MQENIEQKKTMIVAIMGVAFSLIVALFNYMAGVNPILNIAILLCLFIVLGSTIAFSKQEKKQLKEISDNEINNSIDELMPTVSKIVSLLDEVDSRVKQCNELVESSGKRLPDSARTQLKAVIQIRDRLGERASTVRSLIDTRVDEKIKEAKEIIYQPLTFPVDSVNSLVMDTNRLPDLPHDQWEDTVNSILERVSKEAQSLV